MGVCHVRDTRENVREIHAPLKVSENSQRNLAPFAESGKSNPFH